jgi:hypothetical protein
MTPMTDKTWKGCTANWSNISDEAWWIIRSSDQVELARLPAGMNEQAVMAIVHTVRDLETVTFKAGQAFGGNAMLAANRNVMREQLSTIKDLTAHNVMLANKLESLIGDKG